MSGGGDKFGLELYLKEARRLGAPQILSKPFLMNELTDLVKKTLEEGPLDSD